MSSNFPRSQQGNSRAKTGTVSVWRLARACLSISASPENSEAAPGVGAWRGGRGDDGGGSGESGSTLLVLDRLWAEIEDKGPALKSSSKLSERFPSKPPAPTKVGTEMWVQRASLGGRRHPWEP